MCGFIHITFCTVPVKFDRPARIELGCNRMMRLRGIPAAHSASNNACTTM